MVLEIANMNVAQLQQKAVEIKRRLAEKRFDKATGKLIDASAIGKMKKDLARVLTRHSQLKQGLGVN